MASGSQNATIEGFVTDTAFVNGGINAVNLFPSNTANVGELTAKALSYFVTPSVIVDKRTPSSRVVNWSAETTPRIVVDNDSFSGFTDVIKNMNAASLRAFFKIVDKLLFNYDASISNPSLETFLITDTDTKNIYVPQSFSRSGLIVTDTVYTDGNTPRTVSVPAYIGFEVNLPSGQSTQNFTLKLYTSVASWLTTYSRCVITEVVPPLPYNRLYGETLGSASDNIFATASQTATLSYDSLKGDLSSMLVSGMVKFRAVLKDTANEAPVPFNILYKGREPTQFEIRNAVREQLLSSGVGTEEGWRERMPGVFIIGRFYVVPFWDKTFLKPDQVIFPNILNYNEIADTTKKILSSLGYADVTEYMDFLGIYYNQMSASVIPDLSSALQVGWLHDVVPDYQSYSPDHEQFAYMTKDTQSFTRDLNAVLTIGNTDQTSSLYGPNTEGLLSFYSFTTGSYEICVITKLCYQTIQESEL